MSTAQSDVINAIANVHLLATRLAHVAVVNADARSLCSSVMGRTKGQSHVYHEYPHDMCCVFLVALVHRAFEASVMLCNFNQVCYDSANTQFGIRRHHHWQVKTWVNRKS